MKACLGAAIGAALLLAAVAEAGADEPRAFSLVGRRAPDFTVTSAEGRPVTLADLRGNGALVIQFFASYCVECRAEVPALNEAHAALGDQGLRVVGINFGETHQDLQVFVDRCPVKPQYPLYVDAEGSAAGALGVLFVPLNVMIDREGIVRYQAVQLPDDTAATLARFAATGEASGNGGAVGRVAAWFEAFLTSRSVLALPLAFLGGLLSVLLPCVYPVIPVAAAFFGSRASGSKGRAFLLALAYGLGMALLMTALALLALAAGRSIGQIASSRWVNIAVGAVIVFLSLPVMGVIHAGTPTVLGRAQGKALAMKGVPAAFLLGVVSGPVVSVCVAPILGAILLAVAAGGVGLAHGTLLLFLYGLGLATPFILLGTFAGLIKALPKPGRWMRVVQVVFAILMAIVGLYFVVVRGILNYV